MTKPAIASRPAEEDIQALLNEARRIINYAVTDFSLEVISGKFKDVAEAEGDNFIPDYQRTLVWSNQKMSYFIESLLLRIPVPPIFLYDVAGRLEVVDGSQRIRAIKLFIMNRLRLTDLEKLEFLNGFYFRDLPRATILRFHNTPIRTFVLAEEADQSTRVELFRRLNTSGKKLEDAEIRVGAFPGPLMDLVRKCAAMPAFVEVCPAKRAERSAGSERQELVLRFFAYYEKRKKFEHDVARFLDRYLIDGNKYDEAQLNRLENVFVQTTAFAAQHLPYGFRLNRRSKQTPRIRFEALSVGIAAALDTSQNLVTGNIEDWLNSKEFKALTSSSGSNTGRRLRERVDFVRRELLVND